MREKFGQIFRSALIVLPILLPGAPALIAQVETAEIHVDGMT
ncbi:MAG: hypothetical protein O6947_08310 [Acidobacteria bacterium]|nr:hypothetical protein [Acidobacteriota bacterium]